MRIYENTSGFLKDHLSFSNEHLCLGLKSSLWKHTEPRKGLNKAGLSKHLLARKACLSRVPGSWGVGAALAPPSLQSCGETVLCAERK